MRKMAGHIAIVHVVFQVDASIEFQMMIHDMGNRQEPRIDTNGIDTQTMGGGLTDTKPRSQLNNPPENGANKIVGKAIRTLNWQTRK